MVLFKGVHFFQTIILGIQPLVFGYVITIQNAPFGWALFSTRPQPSWNKAGDGVEEETARVRALKEGWFQQIGG